MALPVQHEASEINWPKAIAKVRPQGIAEDSINSNIIAILRTQFYYFFLLFFVSVMLLYLSGIKKKNDKIISEHNWLNL